MARFHSGTEIREVVLGGDRHAYVDQQRALLAAGWRRVGDAVPMSELEQAIHASPDDDQLWLVYADALIEAGDPRGALAALESAPVANIVQRASRDADARRLRQAATDLGRGIVGRQGLGLRWKRGFIHGATLHGGFALGDAEDLLFDLLAHPCARFLRELELVCWHHDAQDHRLLVDLLAGAWPPPPLAKLQVDYNPVEWTGYPPLGDIGALARAYPRLEVLRIDGDDTTRFEGLALPQAKRFGFQTVALRAQALRAIAAAPWPALEDLELWFRDSTCTVDELAFVLGLPRLARLRIRGAAFATELVEQICASPIAGQLAYLDLRGRMLDERAAEALIAARTQFPAKAALEVECPTQEIRFALADADFDIGWW